MVLHLENRLRKEADNYAGIFIFQPKRNLRGLRPIYPPFAFQMLVFISVAAFDFARGFGQPFISKKLKPVCYQPVTRLFWQLIVKAPGCAGPVESLGHFSVFIGFCHLFSLISVVAS